MHAWDKAGPSDAEVGGGGGAGVKPLLNLCLVLVKKPQHCDTFSN